MMKRGYVHGYSEYEANRLAGTAQTLSELLHAEVQYPAGAHVLEVGCGVGAQEPMLVRKSPETRFTSFDISLESLRQANDRAEQLGTPNIRHLQANIFHLPFNQETFDHAFICYVLEHLEKPINALKTVAATVKAGGTVTAIEGDHGSCFFHPETPEARQAWDCLTAIQAQLKGDALIGRRLFSVFHQAGLQDIRISPIVVYCDPTRPELMEGFADKTIVGMLRGIEKEVIERKMINKSIWDKGIQDLLKVAAQGSLSYIFFKATGIR